MEFIRGWAKFTSDKCVEVNGQKYAGKHTLIAVGGRPSQPKIPGTVNNTLQYLDMINPLCCTAMLDV